MVDDIDKLYLENSRLEENIENNKDRISDIEEKVKSQEDRELELIFGPDFW